MQNVTYYNSFLCRPKMNSGGSPGLKQQNYHLVMNLNSLWPFDNGYNTNATANGQILSPNAAINPYSTPVTDPMTTMPGVRDA